MEQPASTERTSVTIPEWCASVGISTSTYYLHEKKGNGTLPRAVKVGLRRRVILLSEIRDWENRMRAQSSQAGGAHETRK